MCGSSNLSGGTQQFCGRLVDACRTPSPRSRPCSNRSSPAERRRTGRSDRASVRSRRRPDQRRARAGQAARRNPREIAQAVVDSGALADVASDLEIAGPGFINVTFSPTFLADAAGRRGRRRSTRGAGRDATSKTVVVDYSAPNVAKEMHVGHLRTTVIGDALVRMLVVPRPRRDPGEPHRRLGTSVRHAHRAPPRHRRGRRRRRPAQGDLDGFYKEANAKFTESEEFQERARERVVLLQRGDPETLPSVERLVSMSNDYFNPVYRKLGVLLTDDDLAGESMYQPLMPEAYERLEAAGLLVGERRREGRVPARLQEPRGRTTAADRPVARRRVQLRHQRPRLRDRPRRAARRRPPALRRRRAAGAAPADGVRGRRDGRLAATRRPRRCTSRSAACSATIARCCAAAAGDSVKLVELLDEAIERADAAVAEKNPDLDGDAAGERGRMIGIGAVKYADLSTDRVKDYVFDWDRMLSFDGNTGAVPAVRACSDLLDLPARRARHARRSAGRRSSSARRRSGRSRCACSPIRRRSTTTLDTYSPHKLCTYVYDLASDFTAFYEHCPVLKADEPLRSSRLALADLTARVLAARPRPPRHRRPGADVSLPHPPPVSSDSPRTAREVRHNGGPG